MGQNGKTIKSGKPHGNSSLAKIGVPVFRAKTRPGAPKGNKNALRTGLHTAEMRDLRRRVADLRRRARSAIANVDTLCAERCRVAQTAAEMPKPFAENACERIKTSKGEQAPLAPALS